MGPNSINHNFVNFSPIELKFWEIVFNTQMHHMLCFYGYWRCNNVCHTLTHACETWALTEDVQKFIRGFNNRCMHSITGQEYRESSINPRYNLMLKIRKRRLRYLGHIPRMDENRLVRRTLAAYVNGGSAVPERSLFQDCGGRIFEDLSGEASNRLHPGTPKLTNSANDDL